LKPAVGIFTLLFLLPALAFGAAPAHDGHHAPTAAQWKLLAFAATNFFIFAFIMFRLARTPLRDFLAVRRARLIEAMAEASRAKEEAERLKAEYEQRLSRLEQERTALVAEVRAIAEADRERAMTAADQAAERMRRDAERTAQSDLERARTELRAEAARLAEEIARGELQQRLTEQDRRRLVGEFLEQVTK
jgi:F-type H+-transporting ATPase subunit b